MGYTYPPTGLVPPGSGELTIKSPHIITPKWTKYYLDLNNAVTNLRIISPGIGLWVQDGSAGSFAAVTFDSDPAIWDLFPGAMLAVNFQSLTINSQGGTNMYMILRWTTDPETWKFQKS